MSKVLNELSGEWENYRGTPECNAAKQACAAELRAALPAVEAERKELMEACRDALFALENPGLVGINVRLKEQLRDALARVKEK